MKMGSGVSRGERWKWGCYWNRMMMGYELGGRHCSPAKKSKILGQSVQMLYYREIWSRTMLITLQPWRPRDLCLSFSFRCHLVACPIAQPSNQLFPSGTPGHTAHTILHYLSVHSTQELSSLDVCHHKITVGCHGREKLSLFWCWVWAQCSQSNSIR